MLIVRIGPKREYVHRPGGLDSARWKGYEMAGNMLRTKQIVQAVYIDQGIDGSNRQCLARTYERGFELALLYRRRMAVLSWSCCKRVT